MKQLTKTASGQSALIDHIDAQLNCIIRYLNKKECHVIAFHITAGREESNVILLLSVPDEVYEEIIGTSFRRNIATYNQETVVLYEMERIREDEYTVIEKI